MRQHLHEAGLDGHVEVSSAGTGDWHIGDRADKRALAVLDRHGYDGSAHRARQFLATSFAECDLVVAMDRDNLDTLRRLRADGAGPDVRLLLEFDPEATATDVPDPYYGGDDGFEDVLAMVEAGCRGLLDWLRVTLPA